MRSRSGFRRIYQRPAKLGRFAPEGSSYPVVRARVVVRIFGRTGHGLSGPRGGQQLPDAFSVIFEAARRPTASGTRRRPVRMLRYGPERCR